MLPHANKIINRCICYKDNDKSSKVMNTCSHVFHPKCIVNHWHFNMEYQNFGCPICDISSKEAIKVIHVAGRTVHKMRETQNAIFSTPQKVLTIDTTGKIDAMQGFNLERANTHENSPSEKAFSNNELNFN